MTHDSCRLPVVATRNLPIAVLALSPRCLSALRVNGVETVGGLLEACALGTDHVVGIGAKARSEIEGALGFLAAAHEGTTIGVGDIAIEALDLRGHTTSALLSQGIKTIGQLLLARRQGVGRRSALGGAEMQTALEEFVRLLGLSDPHLVDEILDARPLLVDSSEVDVRRLIVPATRAVLVRDGTGRHFDVLQARMGLDGSQRHTLSEIGRYLGITKERVRQLESQAIKRAAAVLGGDTSPKHSRIPRALLAEFQTVGSALASLGTLVPEAAIRETLEERYGTSSAVFGGGELELLMRTLGFWSVSIEVGGGAVPLEAWTRTSDFDSALFSRAVRQVRRALREAVLPLPLLDLTLRVCGGDSRLPRAYVSLAVDIGTDIENDASGRYQLRLDCLNSVADKAYRTLWENGDPLDYRMLARLINQRLVQLGSRPDVVLRTLSSQLAADPRFCPIGRSGYWCLSEWKDIRRDTIVELMKEFFHVRQTPASADEVYGYVKAKRSVCARNSVEMYLAGVSDQFVRVSATLYELAEWGSKPHKVGVRRVVAEQDLHRLALAERAACADGTLTVARLVSSLARQMGLSGEAVRRRLGSACWVERSGATFRGSPIVSIGEFAPTCRRSARGGVAARVQSAIVRRLASLPGQACRVRDLAAYVEEHTGCDRPSFYTYLASTEGVRKYREGGTLHCRLVQTVVNLEDQYPALADLQGSATRDEVRRALQNLTVENVDLGLFQLGKSLEAELRTTLLAMRAASVARFPDSALRGLASAIDLAVQVGLIREKHDLTYLRDERNSRAHGEAPNLQERTELLRRAPFLAGLYVQYIVLLEGKRREIDLRG